MIDDHPEDEDLEKLPESLDPMLDEEADKMAERIGDVVKNNPASWPGENDDDVVRERNRQVDSSVQDAAKQGGWNTLPDGTPGECRHRLVVTVHQDKDVIPRLRQALQHAVRICPQTRLVMFVLMDPHLSWRAAWLAFRQEFSRRCPNVALRIEVVGHPRLCFFDVWGRPISPASEGGAGVQDWWRVASNAQRKLLRGRIRLLERLGIAAWTSCAYKKLHTGQPGGNFPDLSFGTYSVTTQRILGWSARIYFDPHFSLPTGFPRRILSAQVPAHAIVRGAAQLNQPGAPWCPKNMVVFENDPLTFIDATALIAHLR